MNPWVLLVQLLLPISQPPSAQNIALPEDIAVCEAIVMARLEGWSAESKAVSFYFEVRAPHGYVSFPNAFFDKHNDHIPSFKRATEFPGRQRAASTLEWSWTFKTPKKIDDGTYTVWGGYSCGPLCALHCDYRVVRQQEKWIIRSTGACVIS
jgi:hypothetical protein